MKHRPLTRWTCDTCGLDVVADEEAENGGYVNWGRGVAPVIVHKFGCQRDALPSSLPLSDFIGADGIALLTGMLSLGRLQVRHRRATRPEELEMLECLDGFVDFFRRVQLPYYEEARSRLATREVYEDWSDASEVAPYLQTSLQRILATGGESAESGDR